MTRISLTTYKSRKLRNALRAAEEAVFEKRAINGKKVLTEEIDDLREAAHNLLLHIEDEEMRVREIKRQRIDIAEMTAAH